MWLGQYAGTYFGPWFDDGATPPVVVPPENTPGFFGLGEGLDLYVQRKLREQAEQKREQDARLAADSRLALVQQVAESSALARIDETQRLTLLYEEFRRIDAELTALYLAEFAARFALAQAQREEEEAIAMMLIAMEL